MALLRALDCVAARTPNVGQGQLNVHQPKFTHTIGYSRSMMSSLNANVMPAKIDCSHCTKRCERLSLACIAETETIVHTHVNEEDQEAPRRKGAVGPLQSSILLLGKTDERREEHETGLRQHCHHANQQACRHATQVRFERPHSRIPTTPPKHSPTANADCCRLNT